MSANRNDSVLSNVNFSHHKFSFEGVDVRMYRTFNDMYNKMYDIWKFISTQTNRHWALLMVDHTTYDKMKSDESVELYWRSYMVQLRSEESDLYKTGRPSLDDWVIFMHHRPESLRFHITLCRLDRASQFSTYASTVHNLIRLRAKLLFRHHHAKGVHEEEFETVRDFLEWTMRQKQHFKE